MEKTEKKLIAAFVKLAEPLARLSFFMIYFWFGVLKILSISPVTDLARDVFASTVGNFIDFPTFYAFFTLFEILIGILFLFPKLTKVTFILFSLHMVSTLLPLIILPEITWSGFGVLTFTGQEIVKNIGLIALAMFLLKANKDSPY